MFRPVLVLATVVVTLSLLLTQSGSVAGQGKSLRTIRWAVASRVPTSIVINTIVGEYLGFYEEEGLKLEHFTLGSNPAVLAGLTKGDIDIGVGVPSFQLPLVARGEKLPAINFYEYTYPFKWDWAVKPDSSITDVSQLKGKRIGVSGFGVSDYPIAKLMLSGLGIDPEKDVQWLAVGEGAPAGVALYRGQIDALFHYDTGFGLIEMAGMRLRYLPRPKGTPMVGGLYLSATRELMNTNPQVIIGMGRQTAKTTVFCLENMDACAYAFIQMFPEAAPKGKPLSEQVKAIRGTFERRSRIWKPYNPTVKKWGYILSSEWWDEVKFARFEDKITDVRQFYTNEFIDEINKFDQETIKRKAQQFKVPQR